MSNICRVNIVFNYDMPEDTDTYLHRVARAGRFGTKVSGQLFNVQFFLYKNWKTKVDRLTVPVKIYNLFLVKYLYG